ncbi:hypothetical protein NHQ30_002147 [Ciborinia camelliae]|nr:hypothetical protein NHQ30_002147 [Ciborinia camelliae]
MVWSDLPLLAGFLGTVIIYIATILLVTPGGAVPFHEWDFSSVELTSRRSLVIWVYIGATISSAFYLALTIVTFYLATPFSGETFESLIFSSHWATLKHLAYPSNAVGLGIDIYLFVLPLIAVSNLRIPRKKKALVMIGFGVGLLCRKSNAMAMDGQEPDESAEQPRPITEKNLYPGLDLTGTNDLTKPGDIEHGVSDSIPMQRNHSIAAEGPIDETKK